MQCTSDSFGNVTFTDEPAEVSACEQACPCQTGIIVLAAGTLSQVSYIRSRLRYR